MDRFHRFASMGFALALFAGCGDDGAADAGADAGPGDAGTLDAPVDPDAGPADGGPPPPVELCDPSFDPGPYPAPDAWPANRGPGGPTRTFAADELYEHCAYLDGGEGDMFDHHNLVVMVDGYLLMPWAPEYGMGGITLWDISDPCAPAQVGYGTSTTMRETHAIGFSSLGGRWAVVDSLPRILFRGGAGIEFWDLSDTSAPAFVSTIGLPGALYPDSYIRVPLSACWQVPYVYVGSGDEGVHVVDAADPRYPRVVNQVMLDPILRVGQVQVIGNLLVATAAEGPRAVLLDVSDPEAPQEIPGGDFLATDSMGMSFESYFTTVAGGFVFFARTQAGGGLMVTDIRDPEAPVHAGDFRSDGNGGYVFVKDGHAFVGESNFASIYDVRDPSAITSVATLSLTGDLDTVVPIGNVAVLSVDDDADPDHGSAIAPFQTDPDTAPPTVTWAWPADSATDLALTSRFGVTFSEMVDPGSAWEGSVRLYETGTDPDDTRVAGTVAAQEHIVNFHPFCPLEPGTSYTLEIPVGGVVDYNGNAIAEPFTATFTTAGP